MSSSYLFDRSINPVNRLINRLAKYAKDRKRYETLTSELLKVGIVTPVNSLHVLSENAENRELALLVNRLNVRFAPSAYYELIEYYCDHMADIKKDE